MNSSDDEENTLWNVVLRLEQRERMSKNKQAALERRAASMARNNQKVEEQTEALNSHARFQQSLQREKECSKKDCAAVKATMDSQEAPPEPYKISDAILRTMDSQETSPEPYNTPDATRQKEEPAPVPPSASDATLTPIRRPMAIPEEILDWSNLEAQRELDEKEMNRTHHLALLQRVTAPPPEPWEEQHPPSDESDDEENTPWNVVTTNTANCLLGLSHAEIALMSPIQHAEGWNNAIFCETLLTGEPLQSIPRTTDGTATELTRHLPRPARDIAYALVTRTTIRAQYDNAFRNKTHDPQGMFRVRRQKVHAALVWLQQTSSWFKQNNIIIDTTALLQLPIDDVPPEFLSTSPTHERKPSRHVEHGI